MILLYSINIPPKLKALLQNYKRFEKAKQVDFLALFPNNGWYILGEKVHLWEDLSEKLTATLNGNGATVGITNIEHDATKPDRFFVGTVVKSTMFTNDFPRACLAKRFRMGPQGGFTKVSLGQNSTWVLQGPSFNSWKVNSDGLEQLMRKNIAQIVCLLSPYNDTRVFVEYQNGTFTYFLPPAWHMHIDKLKLSNALVTLNKVVQSGVLK
ncbi:hypothetical protein FRB96_005269 [Tulasnella sp. 330]|nr:hypothetical protein FRB96_005269 [Tulasnella sp. 330]